MTQIDTRNRHFTRKPFSMIFFSRERQIKIINERVIQAFNAKIIADWHWLNGPRRLGRGGGANRFQIDDVRMTLVHMRWCGIANRWLRGTREREREEVEERAWLVVKIQKQKPKRKLFASFQRATTNLSWIRCTLNVCLSVRPRQCQGDHLRTVPNSDYYNNITAIMRYTM